MKKPDDTPMRIFTRVLITMIIIIVMSMVLTMFGDLLLINPMPFGLIIIISTIMVILLVIALIALIILAIP